MQKFSDGAIQWDVGCENDCVRKNFIIPAATRLFSELKPESILDVGAGTGFTARHIDDKLNYCPSWTLLDSNPDRLALATSKCPSSMKFEIKCENFLIMESTKRKFDALFFGFTLLELGTGDEVLSRIDNLCSKQGTIVIAQPDVMQDVLASCSSDTSMLENFISGPVSLRKTDKFTKTEYPFHAERFESVAYKVMQLGFSLVRFEKEVFDGRAVFMLVFRRQN